MTDKELRKAREALPKWENGTPPVMTPEEKRISKELDCRGMINSLLIYHGEDGIKRGNYFADTYLFKDTSYSKELGDATINRLCAEQLKDFREAVVLRDVGTDSEGVSYNSIRWADEFTLEERLERASARSKSALENTKGLQVTILQLKPNDENVYVLYTRLSSLENGVESVKFNRYDNVYTYTDDTPGFDFSDKIKVNSVLEGAFVTFNSPRTDNRFNDYPGRSLSVSDVVILSFGNERKAYYCDSIGFAELPDVFVKDFDASLKENKDVEIDKS